MTREEAIEWFRESPFYHKNHEPFNMAIKALEQEPCEDAISRQAVISAIDEREDVNGNVNAEDIRTDIVLMQSVNPQPKTGHWINNYDDRFDWLECSECGYGDEGEIQYGKGTRFCPNCGAKMESEGVKKDCTTCILDGTDACVSGASDDVCEGYIAESEEQA